MKRSNLFFLSGDGEMATRTRNFDWSQTGIGAPDTWSHSLRTTIGILLNSAFPMFLFWGKDLLCFYNDAYRPSLGQSGKHPALGKKATEVWSDIWEFVGPLVNQVMSTGKPVWFEDQYVPFYRNGRVEDIYWTFSYSPVYNDDGIIEGLLVTCTETTEKVRNEERLKEAEKRFATLIHEATVGIAVNQGENHTVTMANDAYTVIAGRSKGELIGRPLFDTIPEAEPYYRYMMDTVLKTGEPYYLYDHPYFVLVDGKEKHGFLNIVFQPYREDNNTVTGVMTLCEDVSGLRNARQQARQTEQRLHALVESSPFPIAVYTGPEMRIELANKAIMDIWGKGKDVIGKRFSEVLPELENQGIFQQLEDVFTTGTPFHARNRRVDLFVDGRLQPFYFNYSYTPLYDEEGGIYGVLNTGAETTDLNPVHN